VWGQRYSQVDHRADNISVFYLVRADGSTKHLTKVFRVLPNRILILCGKSKPNAFVELADFDEAFPSF
jgi:hypothetical protein